MSTTTVTRSRGTRSTLRAARPIACAFTLGVMLVSCADATSAPAVQPLLAVAGSGGAYAAQLNDSASYKLRSDEGTTYTDGSRCVYSHRSAGGFFQLRTISNTTECKAVQRPGWRWFSIDLGASNALDLDQDGMAEPIENAPARMLTSDAFANGASTTPVRILVLEVNADGSTTQDAAWDLVYSFPAGLTATSSGGRIIVAGPGAVSVLKPMVVGRKVVWSQVGTVSLPFSLTLEP